MISFGGTKAGLAFGEAVVFLDPALAERAMYVRKQVNQLSSKMRFVAAQFNALLHDDLWIRAAEQANAMTQRLYRLTDELADGGLRRRPAGQQPVPQPAAGGDRAAARVVLLLGLGRHRSTRCAG